MADNSNKGADKAPTNKKISTASFKQDALRVIDWIVQAAAALFFIATSYGFVSEWLKTHQNRQDLSVAGGIMVVSIALYLFTRRKR